MCLKIDYTSFCISVLSFWEFLFTTTIIIWYLLRNRAQTFSLTTIKDLKILVGLKFGK